MDQKVNCVAAAAIVSALIPLHGFKQTDFFAVYDGKDPVIAGLAEKHQLQVLGMNEHRHVLVGPLNDDQLFVLTAVERVSPNIAVFQPSSTNGVGVEIHDEGSELFEYVDGSEALIGCANAIPTVEETVHSAAEAGLHGDDYLCLTVSEFIHATHGGGVAFIPQGNGFFLSETIAAEVEPEGPQHGDAIVGDLLDGVLYVDRAEAAALFGEDWAAQLVDVPADVQQLVAEVPAQEETMSEREEIAIEACVTIGTDRNNEYGEPEDCFARIASLWAAYLGCDIAPEEVAWMMVLLKACRAEHGYKRDNYIDAAGYAAIAGELALDEATSPETIH